VTADPTFGRPEFEGKFYGHSYVLPEETSTADAANRRLFVWIDPSMWGVAPPFLRGRRVALIANTPIVGHGATIDAFDEVVRINRMEYWRQSAADDGIRLTIWAGVPLTRVISGGPATAYSPIGHTNFPRHASALKTIWSATPFHLSVAFYRFLLRQGLLDRLFVSGSSAFLHDYLAQQLPPAMLRALFSLKRLYQESGGPVAARQPEFELLLTGVRLILFCMLAGAREIGLFGFNFYEGAEKQPWGAHDLAFEKDLLSALTEIAPRFGCQIVRH
jgi:hypothetical protein